MARARRAASTSQTSETVGGEQAQETFTCPECGKSFARAASLGAHRQRTHGIAGAKAKTRSRRRRAARTGAAASAATGGRQRQRRAPARAGETHNGGVDRDALLQAIFPNGLPAREEVIRRANAWLDEAEQLAAAK